jgi:hypothetical protein
MALTPAVTAGLRAAAAPVPAGAILAPGLAVALMLVLVLVPATCAGERACACAELAADIGLCAAAAVVCTDP